MKIHVSLKVLMILSATLTLSGCYYAQQKRQLAACAIDAQDAQQKSVAMSGHQISTWDRALLCMKAHGYEWDYLSVDCANYGIPLSSSECYLPDTWYRRLLIEAELSLQK